MSRTHACACILGSFVRSSRPCVLVYVHASHRREYAHLHAYLHARVPLYDSRDRYMHTRSSPHSLSRSRYAVSFSPSFPSFSFALFFALAPSLLTALSSSFGLTLARSPRLSLLFPAPRPPPLSTPSRIFYSFFFSLFLSFAPSPPPCAFVSLYSIPSLSVFPKLLPPSLATAYSGGSRTGGRRPPVSTVDVP